MARSPRSRKRSTARKPAIKRRFSSNRVDAFGEYDPELVKVEARSRFPEPLEVGMQFEGTPEDGEDDIDSLIYTVTDVAEDKVVLDGNHPLAGMALRFALSVQEVRTATEDEIEHQHAHGADGLRNPRRGRRRRRRRTGQGFGSDACTEAIVGQLNEKGAASAAPFFIAPRARSARAARYTRCLHTRRGRRQDRRQARGRAAAAKVGGAAAAGRWRQRQAASCGCGTRLQVRARWRAALGSLVGSSLALRPVTSRSAHPERRTPSGIRLHFEPLRLRLFERDRDARQIRDDRALFVAQRLVDAKAARHRRFGAVNHDHRTAKRVRPP